MSKSASSLLKLPSSDGTLTRVVGASGGGGGRGGILFLDLAPDLQSALHREFIGGAAAVVVLPELHLALGAGEQPANGVVLEVLRQALLAAAGGTPSA